MTEELHQGARPLLTIAIPTYNRARYLKELLSTLIEQLRNEAGVELIISDNASTDDTPAVIDEAVRNGLKATILRNSENIGPDANFQQCFERALGNYFWILGDDEVVVQDALSKILRYLETSDYDLIYVNSYMFSEFHAVGRASDSLRAIEICDAADFARRVNAFFTFISGNIVNRDCVLNHAHQELNLLVGTGLVQLGWTYAALDRFRRGLYISDKLVGMRVNNTGGYNLLDVFGPTINRITCERISSPAVRRGIMNGVIQCFWPGILMMMKRAATRFTDEMSPEQVLTPVFGSNCRYWAFTYPIMVLPPVFAKAWYFFVRALNRLDRSAGFVLLR